VTVTGSQTLVGSSNNVPSDAEVVTKSGEGEGATETPAPYYVITYKNGTLTVTDQNVTPSLVVTKSHEAKTEGEDKYAEGETVTFDISVKNIYNTAKTITLTEIPGVTLAQTSFNNVDPGETKTTTATYTRTTSGTATSQAGTNTVTYSSQKIVIPNRTSDNASRNLKVGTWRIVAWDSNAVLKNQTSITEELNAAGGTTLIIN
jgi:hypothetical protein